MSENTRFVNYKTNKLLEEVRNSIKALQLSGGTSQPVIGSIEEGAGFKPTYEAPAPKNLKGENEVI